MWISSQPRELIAQTLRVISIVLGIPSATAFVFSGWTLLELRFLRPAQASSGSPTGNALIDGLVAGTRLVAAAFSFAGLAAEWAMAVLTIASLFLTVLAAVLFTLARGLHAERTWARLLGIALAVVSILFSILIMTSSHRPVLLTIGATGTVLAGYVIWGLGWRYA